MWGDLSRGGAMLHDVDRDAVTMLRDSRGCSAGLGRGAGGRRRVTNLQRDAARQETVDFQLSNDDIWVLRESYSC